MSPCTNCSHVSWRDTIRKAARWINSEAMEDVVLPVAFVVFVMLLAMGAIP